MYAADQHCRPPCLPRRRSSVRGMALLEVLVAAAIVGALLTVSVSSLAWSAHSRRSIERRELALQEAANLLEQVRSLAWNEVTAEKLAELSLSSPARQSLPGARLKVTADPGGEGLESKRVTVEVAWLNRAGATEAPVRLLAWIYPEPSR